MAKCKICKANIADGKEYCNTCQDKSELISNESYLDGLLNSVKSASPETNMIYKKKSDTSENSYMKTQSNITKTVDTVQDLATASKGSGYDLATASKGSEYDSDTDIIDTVYDSDIESKDTGNNLDLTSIDTGDYSGASSIDTEYALDADTVDTFYASDMDNYEVDSEDLDQFLQYDLSDDLEDDLDDASRTLVSDEELFGEDLSKFFLNNEIGNQENLVYAEEEYAAGLQELLSPEEDTPKISANSDTLWDESEDNLESKTLTDATIQPEEIYYEEDTTFLNPDFYKETDSLLNSGPYEGDDSFLNSGSYEEDNSLLNSGSYEEEDSLQIPNSFEAEGLRSNEYDSSSPATGVNFTQSEIAGLEQEDDFDTDLNDLLSSLDNFQLLNGEEQENENYVSEENNTLNSQSVMQSEDEDLLELLNQISSDDPVADDVRAINDLLNRTSEESQLEPSMPSDVGDVFSDALKVVTNLNDSQEAFNGIVDKKKTKKFKKEKKTNKVNNDNAPDTDKEKKPSLFSRIFGNVKEKKENPESGQLTTSVEDELTITKEKPKKVKAKKDKKASRAKKAKNAVDANQDPKDPKETIDATGNAAKDKKLAKKEKKANKKLAKDVIQVIDEIDEDEGRINLVGAAVVFVFFGLLVSLLLVGTKVVSYSISIENATNYFEKQKYTEAYREVYGMDIKDEDIELYDKIMTVMFVNKQLNSYNNYYSIGKYPEALDSLLKGLSRYDKYIELATMLGIKSDLDYVREQIIAELDNIFKLSEKEAMKLIKSSDMTEYSTRVYDVVFENMDEIVK